MNLKHSLSSLMLLYFSTNLISQELQLGIYQPIYSDPSYTYEFLEENKFNYTYYGHMNQTTRGKGHYLIKGDSIYFNYEPLALDEKFLSSYEVTLNPKESDILMRISLSVFDLLDSLPFMNAWVDISSENTKPTKLFDTDKNGKLSMTLFKPIEENILTIGSMGYKSVRLRLDTIKSVSAEITAYLRPTTEYVKKELQEKFKLEIVNDTTFIMSKINGLETRFLKTN